MSDIVFANGMIIKDRGAAPEYVIAKVSIKVEEFIQTLQENNNNGWVNIEIKQAKSGKNYAAIDTWKPNQDNPANQGYVTKQAPTMPQQSNNAPPPPAPFPTGDNIPGLEAGDESIEDVPF